MQSRHFLTAGLLVATLAAPGAVHPNTNPFIGSVAVGVAPSAITVDEETRRAFVVNNGPPYTVSVLDTQTGKVLRTVTVSRNRFDLPSGPVVVDVRHNRALTLNAGSDTVSVLDATTGQLLHIVSLGFGPQYVAVDSSRGRAFFPNSDEEADDAGIAVLDTWRMRTVRTVPIRGNALAVDEHTGHVFIRTNSNVSMFEEATGRVLATARVAGAPVAVDPTAHRVFILKSSPLYTVGFALSMLDARTAAVVRSMPLPLDTTYAVAVDSRRSRAFLAIGPVIDVLDTLTGRILRRIVVNRGLSSFGSSPLAVDAGTGHVFAISNTLDRYGTPSGPGVVRIYDPGTGAQLGTIRVSPRPVAIAIDNRTRRVFIVHGVAGVSTQLAPGSRGSVTILDASHL